MGAIYANLGERPQQRGHLIRRNYFHDIGRSGEGQQGAIYPDNMTMGWIIEENVFHKIGRPGSDRSWTILSNGGSYIAVRNNVFVDCVNPFTQAFIFEAWAKSWLPRYRQRWEAALKQYGKAGSAHALRYPEFLNLLQEDRVLPDTNVFEKNLIYNPTVPRVYEGPCRVRHGAADRLTVRDNWIAATDPGFGDVGAMDFQLRPDAAILHGSPAFSSISFEQIRLRRAVGPMRTPVVAAGTGCTEQN